MTTVELSIGFAFPIVLMILGYWKEEVWLFYLSSVLWLVLMGFLFNNYGSADFLYYIAWVCLALAIVCATSQLWMNKGKQNPIEPQSKEEELSEHREKRSQKIAGLRNLTNKLRGKDY